MLKKEWLSLTLAMTMLGLACIANGCASQQQAILYFADDQVMYLIPENRMVKGNNTLEEVILNELIQGPKRPGLRGTIPEGTKLISVSVADHIAYVNFSREFKTKHWGGTSCEWMTIYSVVNSLAKVDGIEKVQFLVEGAIHDDLAGHMSLKEPIAPDFSGR